MSRRHKRKNGFTLIELTVVLFIIGLVSFIAMPRVSNFLYQSDLKSVTRSLKAAVRLLRSKSILTHRNTLLHFDLDQGLYWGTYAKSDDSPSLSRAEIFLFSPKKLPEGMRFLDVGNVSVAKKTYGTLSSLFNPKGVFEETVLHLADQNDQVMTIIINAYTGRFMIYNQYVDVEYGEE